MSTNFIIMDNYPSFSLEVALVPARMKATPKNVGRSRGQTITWRTRTLRARDQILPTIQNILDILQAAKFSSRELFAVHVALEEALVNAIQHGHRGDPSKEVRLRYRLAADCLVVEIEDQGPGFKLADLPNPIAPENLDRPCGRGLLLMRSYMTWVRFNRSGNRVTMCRRRLSA